MAPPDAFCQFGSMKPRTEEFLNFLLWSAEKLTQPTFRNLTGSYESWAYRNGLLRQVATLERWQLVERNWTISDLSYRLTKQGWLHALGGREPQARWSRRWDGRWRMVVFDIPITHNSDRSRLRRYLRDNNFGCLQSSVWITPDPLDSGDDLVVNGRINVESLIVLEARPCAGESDTQIVAGAWDFSSINRRYSQHMETLDERPRQALTNDAAARSLRNWATTEREAWLAAVRSDPLLPQSLLPPDYLGQQAWRRRIEVLTAAQRQLRTFCG
jgi:DNA-binding transcriptional regulator PaaX